MGNVAFSQKMELYAQRCSIFMASCTALRRCTQRMANSLLRPGIAKEDEWGKRIIISLPGGCRVCSVLKTENGKACKNISMKMELKKVSSYSAKENCMEKFSYIGSPASPNASCTILTDCAKALTGFGMKRESSSTRANIGPASRSASIAIIL